MYFNATNLALQFESQTLGDLTVGLLYICLICVVSLVLGKKRKFSLKYLMRLHLYIPRTGIQPIHVCATGRPIYIDVRKYMCFTFF